MRAAREIAARVAAGGVVSVGGAGAGEPPSIDAEAGRVVNALFRELQSCFPAWRRAWPNDEALAAAKKTWIKGFAAAGIHRVEQIKHGIEQCRLMPSDFIPSIGRFIELCRPTPESLGLPSEARAFAEATRNAHPSAVAIWSHPAVSHAAREAGLFNLMTLPAETGRVLFGRCYAIACRMVIDGEPLAPILPALPQHAEGRRTPEVARAALAALRRSTGTAPEDGGASC